MPIISTKGNYNLKSKVHIIGGVEKVTLPSLGTKQVLAKVDTGADISSIWCGHIKRLENGIECIFFAPKSEYYTGQKYFFKKEDYKVSRIYSSFGHDQRRYKIKLPIIIGNRRILASFTLADRSQKTYPILIGRRLIAKKFLVDVAIAQEDMRKKLKHLRGITN